MFRVKFGGRVLVQYRRVEGVKHHVISHAFSTVTASLESDS